MPLSAGDEEFLKACSAAGTPRAEDLPAARAGLSTAEALFGRPVPIGPFLLQQQWATAEAVAAARAATRRDLRLCPHCWARLNVFDVPARGAFECRPCGSRVLVPVDPLAELLAADEEGAAYDPATHPPDQARTLARHGIRAEAVAGWGGAGTVWRAVLLPRRTPVAAKVLHGELTADPAACARLQREARAACAVRHPNLVPVLHAALGHGFPFLLQEWVEGADLRRHVEARGRIPPAEALALAADVARGLAAVHAAGLVHRDVKPANVLLPETGGARLSDFGLARAVAGESLAVTRTGDLVGTVQYTAPEQWRNPRRATPASDVYGLGATLVHLLSGRPPFDGALRAGISERLLAGETARLEDDSGFPAAIALLVGSLTAADPSRRPADGAAALRAIEQAAAAEG